DPLRASGVFYDVDGRPWELSERDAAEHKAISNRGPVSTFFGTLLPIFQTTMSEFEQRIQDEARLYRSVQRERRLTDGTYLDEVSYRKSIVHNELRHNLGEAITTADNATFFLGIGKAAIKPVAIGARRLGTSGSRTPVRATRELADEIANVGPPRSRQTVSLIETREGPTIISGGATDLTAAQKLLARERGLLVADDLPGFHAEITGVYTAGQ